MKGDTGDSMTEPIVCVSFDGVTVDEILEEAARANLAGADLVELRFDRLYLISPPAEEIQELRDQNEIIDESTWERRDLGDVNVDEIISTLKDGIAMPVIFTCRGESEGGYYPGDEKSRLKVLESAIESGVTWVDLELSIATKQRAKMVSKARDSEVKIIASVHGLDGVPDAEKIVDLVKENSESGDVVKCCYLTLDYQQSLAIIDAADSLKDEEIKCSIMGLGPGGDWTRIHAPLLNQAIVYTTLRTDFKLYEEGMINVKDVHDAWLLLEY